MAASVRSQSLPATVQVTIDPVRFGDVASILKVDSTVASFRFDAPVSHLALVLEAYPKEPTPVPVGRLALELTKPITEGRLCVQMADQGFLPLGNGAPHQMQLFLQMDCGGSIISSSQSFLKEKFNFGRSLSRAGSGTLTRKVTSHRAPVLWLMGNSDSGTYFNDDDLEKMVAKNHDAYVIIGYLEVSKVPLPPAKSEEKTLVNAASNVADPDLAAGLVGPPYPVPARKDTPKEEVSAPKPKVNNDTESKEAKEPTKAKRASSSSSKKKQRRT